MVLQRGWSWASEKASAFSYLSADVYWALWASDTLTTGRAAPGHLQLFSLRLPSCFNSLTSDPSQGTLCLQILPHSSQMASAIRKWSRLKRHQKSQKPLEPRARFFWAHGKWGRILQRQFFFSFLLRPGAIPPLLLPSQHLHHAMYTGNHRHVLAFLFCQS